MTQPDVLPGGSWPVLFTPFTEDNRVDEQVAAQLEFYLQANQAGIFAAALSGEVFALSPTERTRVCECLVAAGKGRIPIVAGGNFGPTLAEQATSIRTIQETGVEAAVILVSLLPTADDLAGQILHLADCVPGPLGIYECPAPEHRLLTPKEVGRLAETGRFTFMKETSRDVDEYGRKLAAANGTSMRVYQANLRCAPKSIERGGPGVCGIFSNFCPEWSARLCQADLHKSQRDALFRALVALHDVVLSHGYPSSGKYVLQKRGIPITTVSRRFHTRAFDAAQRQAIDAFLDQFDLITPNISQAQLDALVDRLGTPALVD